MGKNKPLKTKEKNNQGLKDRKRIPKGAFRPDRQGSK